MKATDYILLVEDDQDICELVEAYLTQEGFRVCTASDGPSMRRMLKTHSVGLVLLDLMLPGEDGLHLARELRAQSDIGIIILTGRSETVDRIIGLEMGADDYLAKPFHLRELLARVRSVLRRTGVTEPRAIERPTIYTFNGWRLDLGARELRMPTMEEVHLTTGEFDLLAALITHAGQILSRDQLLDLARHREAGPADRTIDVQVGRLRRKLQDDPYNPVLIKTVRGSGYMFAATVEQIAADT